MNSSVKKKAGFTLIEVLIAVIIIGIAVAALVGSNGYYSYASAVSADTATAEFLISQIKTATSLLPVRDPQTGTDVFGPEEDSLSLYDDVDDFDGAVFSPPIDAQRNRIAGLGRFIQKITVQNVSGSDFRQVVSDNGSDFIKITVEILADGKEVSSSSWFRALSQ